MYPYSLLSQKAQIFPIFGEYVADIPGSLDYSDINFTHHIDPTDQDQVESYNKELLITQQTSWAMGGYLEDRSYILSGTHIKEEGRIYHLGVDVVFPAGTQLYAPLPGKVYEFGYEPGDGNYGGYIIIEHFVGDSSFFALYGHLSYSSIIHTQDSSMDAGERFGELGKRSENGNWFEHLHLQAFTGRDIEKWKHKGYCSLEDLPTIHQYCPDPNFLIRY